MRAIIRWAVQNTPAMNTVMVTVLVLGLVSLGLLRREVFPSFDLDIILVTVPYPGASPAEVEEGICQKIEEAVSSIDGLKKVTAVAAEGAGSVVMELYPSVTDPQRILNDIRSEVDRIPSFPVLAEDPEVKQLTIRKPAVKLAVIAPDDKHLSDEDQIEHEIQLRRLTERIRDELLLEPDITQAELDGVRDFQIDVEISEDTLQRYGLTLTDVANILRRENIEVPGGKLLGDSGQVLLRGKGKRLVGSEIADIVLVRQPNGATLTVGDIGEVKDEFTDVTSINRINGRPGLVITVNVTETEDILAVADEVREFVKRQASVLPHGYELVIFNDVSIDVRDRLNLLAENGTQGLILVFLVLAIFLDLRLAFWVALGIPISILGACGVMFLMGETLNMLTMFAFLLALGIVVDDAIVIGENIYAHREMGKSHIRAAIDGTVEVVPSVFTSVMTTIIAFLPLMFVSGTMGKFMACLPLVVISMLLISLVEAFFILPCHLSEEDSLFFRVTSAIFYIFRPFIDAIHWVNHKATDGLTWFIDNIYKKLLIKSLAAPLVVVSIAFALLVISVGFELAGITPWIFFPDLDANTVSAKVVYPDGTPSAVSDAATKRLEESGREILAKYQKEDQPQIALLVHRNVGSMTRGRSQGGSSVSGSHFGGVSLQLVDPSLRDVTSQELKDEWRKAAGEFPGAESVVFSVDSFGPGGTPIEFKLLAGSDQFDELEAATDEVKQKLNEYTGVFDVDDDSRPGKWEYQLAVKDTARSLGIALADIAETVRASYYGEEVMRLQRGRHEVKLMVRYPEEERQSLQFFDDIRIRTTDGMERPLPDFAEVNVERGYSEINRVDQLRSITISANVNKEIGNAPNIIADLKENFLPQLFAEYPGLSVRWEGEQERSDESLNSMIAGYLVALAAMYVLLTLEFRSYMQPVLILSIIPFGAIGAIWGHVFMGIGLTIFSMYGLVALTGVVINDSIVLIDFINHRLKDGLPLKEALIDAGSRRFRPVLLTSVTTIAGMVPILLETSRQAQILIPMATSLAFGLMLTTLLVLILVPSIFYLYYNTRRFLFPHFEEHEAELFAEEESPATPVEKREEVGIGV
ncbi:Efflux RND transporter permease subunit [Planctomycetales bacterium 10988]|nr:Efflux RND transporter permease subunit [Planctomycetales bacterium 10988]